MNSRSRVVGPFALAAALAVGLLLPTAGTLRAIPPTSARTTPEHPAGGRDGAQGALQNLPGSLLVSLRQGADPAAADVAAVRLGLVRVAWNPTLRTAQYVAVAGAAGTVGQLTVAAATTRAHRDDGQERARLNGLATTLRHAAGVVAASTPVRLEVAEDPAPVPAPNDTYWSSQWAPDAIGTRSAWALTRGRPEIVVAVIDTGVDLSHPDLAGRLVQGTDLGDGDRDPSDENGHGTHVAGIVAATAGNARGVAGTAPGVLVMPVKVMDANGSIWDTTVAEGILWAVARGARVLNLSLGGGTASPTINAAIDNARSSGVVVVAAAGNDGDVVSQPAAYPPALAVAAVEDRPASVDANLDLLPDGCSVAKFGPGDYRRALYSNFEPGVLLIDLAAPGSCILSTYPTASGHSYAYFTGTSMATPMVAAAAALVLSRNPSLTADEVEAALVGTAADLGPAGPDPETGAGLLRVGAAVAAIAAPVSDGIRPGVRWSGIVDGTLVRGTLAMTATVTDTSAIVATRIDQDGRPIYVRRATSVAVPWNSASVPDGLHTWTARGTDTGLLVGSAAARILVANRRAATAVRAALTMTSTARSITRTATLRARSPLVVRATGPTGAGLVVSVVSSSGRIVAQARGTGSAVIALSSLAAGRYRLRVVTPVARRGLVIRIAAAWFR